MRFFEYVSGADNQVPLPKRSTKLSSGYDFYAPCDIIIPAHGTSKLIPLNVKCKMEDNEYLALHIRSSLAVKYGLQVMQGTAIIDADYFDNETNEGNIGVKFINHSNEDYVIKTGERCCQGIFCKYAITDDDEASGERTGGYGSTNK